MFVIGLTGGLGSGKSTVASLLEQKGAKVVNADLVGHEIYRAGTEGWRRIADAFGREVLGPDGEVDRRKLSQIVFSDPQALRRLNSITHPLIKTAIEDRLAEMRASGTAVAVLEAALLIEAKWMDAADEIWVVTAPRDTALDRVAARSGLSRQEAEARLSRQLSDEERAIHAHVIIDNGGSLEGLKRRLDELWTQVEWRSSRGGGPAGRRGKACLPRAGRTA